ncbi:ABC transporter substrate-binding protein [Ensifer adhaerens]|uniref:substrate-binding periplasmic protein n=1 Tax=Ensifer adhaerens TaxID=106592 RepID=UPI001CBBAEB1|nr:ABC transporter substrate-binding protein [Ensifer adhaerens]MBZ7924877.1 ABC transporter substrate-binding protein [Ensifer adhaerens]UAX95908.1 ABC transporter substrate-binding protein [Ensifer adhaerens]UAY04750.1 ABC transporter substrate-binding protein [Ensifer adhaerens]UAY10181.1 ABC transporter substrate-binding protein [Ensifer adhaerens]
MLRMGKKRCFVAGALSAAIAFSTPSLADTITAGSPPSSAPSTFLNTKTGKIEGYMPEIALEIARRQNLDLKFDAVIFATLVQSVIAGKIDMIVAGMTPNEQRAKFVDFSQPILAYGEGIFVRDDQSKTFKTAKDFKDEVVGAMAGTTYGSMLQDLNVAKEVKFYDSAADLARDVSLGRVVAGMNDYPIIKGQQAAGALQGMHVVEEYEPLLKEDVAFGVRKGNKDLLDKINASLTEMKEDGTLKKILAKWGMDGIL